MNPPEGARRLLEWCARRLDAPDLAQDALELFAERVPGAGARAARRWYRRQALAALGRAIVKRRARRGGWLRGGALDAKVGLRLLARYPGLTLVGGLAMAFAIFAGATTFEFVGQNLDPRLPLPEGDRIVGLRFWDRAANEEVLPLAGDYRVWRDELANVRPLAAFRADERNLSVGDEAGAPVRVARMTPGGFAVAGVAPLLGRTLLPGDDDPSASSVVVLGHDVWRARFDADARVIGRVVRLGEETATVIGVMPDGFAFPRDQEVWTVLAPERIGGDEPLRVFGRLAAGATREEAEAELRTLAARVADSGGALHGSRRVADHVAQVLPHVHALMSNRVGLALRAMIHQVNVLATLFVVLVSATVALLMFARAMTREREIVVRSALGASRRRIVWQLFVEALTLSTLAATLGLVATGPALRWLYAQLHAMGGTLPFWMVPRISPSTILYALALALLSAVVAGIVPALKATARDTYTRLQRTSPGAGTLRLGGIWAVIIITQIAATVLFTAIAGLVVRQAERSATLEARYAAAQFLGVRLEMDGDGVQAAASSDTVFRREYAEYARELKRRIAAHGGVAGVTLVERLPLKTGATAPIELDDDSVRAAAAQHRRAVVSGAVDPDFFRVLDVPAVAGRVLDARDAVPAARTVVVNESFVTEILGGRSALGRRIRYARADSAGEREPWYEIVGVVRDLHAYRAAALDLETPTTAAVYHALAPVLAGYPVHLVVHAPTGPASLVAPLAGAARAVSPRIRVLEPTVLDRVNDDLATFWRLWADLVVAVSAIALFLSLAGIYAVMSFTVARRRREIGVRVALGARTLNVIRDIFRAPLSHIAIGVGAGCVLVAIVAGMITTATPGLAEGALLLLLGAGMLAICALACAVPTLRALRIQPAETLRTEL